MEKVSTKSFFWFWALLGLASMILIWFLPWRFQTNDDELMMWLVSGAYTGEPESFAVFIHPILSWSFSKLYTFFPAIPWYPLTWFLGMYLSYLVFLDLVSKKNFQQLSFHIWALFLFAFLIHFSFFLQFSIVSAFAVAAGISARILKWNSPKIALTFYRTDILILLGFLIRVEVPFLILTGLLVLNLILRQRRIFQAVLIPLLLLFVFFGLTQLGVNQMGLGDFQKLNKLRSQVFDHPVLQLNKDDFKEDDPSLYYFANGLIDFGTDDLSIKKLQDWKQLLDQKRVAYLSFESIVKSLYFFIIHERFFLLLIGSFFCFGIVKDWNLTLRLTSFLSIVVLFSSPFFLLKVQIYVLVFIVFFCLFFIFSKNDTRNQSFNLIYFLFLISIVVYHVFSLISYSNIDSSTTKMEKLILKANANNSGEVFLIASNVDYMKIIPGRPANFKLLGWITLLEKCQKKDLNSNRIYLIEKEIYESNSMYFEKSASNYSGSMRIILFEK